MEAGRSAIAGGVTLRAAWQELPAWSRWLLAGSLGLGVLLRLMQYGAASSLWLDELALANNLVERSAWELLAQPLQYLQVAPAGFLLLENALLEWFGRGEYTLRLYSLVAGIGSLGAIALVAWRLGQRETVWVAPLVLAVAGPFIFQSAQLKPYSGDVFLTLGLIALTLRLLAQPDAPGVWPAVAGVLAPWFSFAAVLALAALGALLLLAPSRRQWWPVVLLWAVSAGLAVLHASAVVHPETTQLMREYWGYGEGFAPRTPAVLPWLVDRMRDLLWAEVGYRGVIVWLFVAAAGLLALARRSVFATLAVAGPVLVSLLVAMLQRYPLAGRVSQWVAALLIVLIAAAVAAGARLLTRFRVRPLVPVLGLSAAALPAVTLVRDPPPYRVDHVKPVLAAMEATQSDRVYVHPGAWHAFRFYGDRSGIAPVGVLYGRCPKQSLREPLRELDALRGEPRVWIFFAHMVTQQSRRMMLAYLDSIGVRRRSISYPDPYVAHSASVDAHLYDLSDAARLGRSSAETFPVPRADLPAARTRCMMGMVPLEMDARGNPLPGGA